MRGLKTPSSNRPDIRSSVPNPGPELPSVRGPSRGQQHTPATPASNTRQQHLPHTQVPAGTDTGAFSRQKCGDPLAPFSPLSSESRLLPHPRFTTCRCWCLHAGQHIPLPGVYPHSRLGLGAPQPRRADGHVGAVPGPRVGRDGGGGADREGWRPGRAGGSPEGLNQDVRHGTVVRPSAGRIELASGSATCETRRR
jgi:hypothetical protein